MHYIYSFQDYLEIKESTDSSVTEIESISIRKYRSEEKEIPFTTEQLKEVFTACTNVTDLSIYDIDIFHVPDEIGYLKSLTELYIKVKEELTISDKIGELSLLQSISINTEDTTFQLPSTVEQLENILSITIKIPHFSFPTLDKWKKLNSVSIDTIDLISNFNELTKISMQLGDFSMKGSFHEEDVKVIAQMEYLRQLTLNLNDIKRISSLEKCTYLSDFYLTGQKIIEVDKIPKVTDRITINTPSIQKIEFTPSNTLMYFDFKGSKTLSLDFEKITTDFPALERMEIKSCGNESIDILCVNLQALNLESLPKLHTLSSFETSKLKQLKLSKLPKLESLANFSFSKKTDLDFLKFNHLGITAIPIFENVKINEFECRQCENISTDNQFEFLMNVGPKSFFFPELIEIKRSQSFIFKFVSALSKSKLTLEDKRRFFDLYIPHYKSYTTKNLIHTKTDILKLSSISYAPLQKQIVKDISVIVKKEIVENPLSPTMKLAILGNTGTNKLVFKQRLTLLGITYHGKIQEDTTHVIIGKSIKEFDVSENLTWISEEFVTDYLNEQGETPYLLEESEEGNNQNKENVLQLLLAGGDNALIALEILSAGGVPKELLIPLLFVQKTDDDKKVKDKAKKLLLANAPVSFQAALADRGRFVITKTEKDLSKHLNQLSAKAPDVDWIEFCNFYYQKHEKALPFIFENTQKQHPIRQALFTGLINQNCLDLFKALVKQTPDYTNFYAYESYRMREDNVPIEVFEQTDLIELSLKGFALGQVPKEINQLVNLKTLNLASNLLTSLPEELKALTKLETLILSDNEFIEIPMIIGELKSLKKVEIRSNRKKYDYAFITEVSNTIKQQLPACTFVYN